MLYSFYLRSQDNKMSIQSNYYFFSIPITVCVV
ncbi:hypothetical protein CHELA20_52861 [Hyphomicrobiales bacterium]|nr:hypothetical protein CHELA20_52861 [Hyphomicrobiales bacterium]